MTRTIVCSCNPSEGINRHASLLWLASLVWLAIAGLNFVAAQPPVPVARPAVPAAKPSGQGAAKPGSQTGVKPATPAKPAVPSAKPAKTPAAKAAPAVEENKPPEPEAVFLDTKDMWRIHCLYYPPMEKVRKSKETVPVILLHGWGGQGSEYGFLATGLQTYGHACIVPDLRGHGRSTTRKKIDGTLETIKQEDLKPQDIENMLLDLEAVKSFLMEKNNAGELNIEMLTVIAAQEGCIIALNWAALDWSWPVTPSFKQGQDVKALILLSPTQSYKRLSASAALNTPAVSRQLSLLFAVGAEDRAAYNDARRIYSRLERIRPPLPDSPQDRMRLKDLFFITAPTTLQGSKLTARNLSINRAIVTFIQARLLEHRDEYQWTKRESPLGG